MSASLINRVSTGLAPPPAKWPHTLGDHAQLRARHVSRLPLVVLWRKVEVLLAGHEDGPGLDGGERALERAVEARGPADVAVLPRPELREQIVGVSIVEEKPSQNRDQEVL